MKKYKIGQTIIGKEIRKITLIITLPKWDKINTIKIANDICGGTNYRSCEIMEE